MRYLTVCLAIASACLFGVAVAAPEQATPAELYGELFERVQLSAVYPDSKTFVDALPNRPPAQVVSEYREARAHSGFDLRAFIAERFAVPRYAGAEYRPAPGEDVRAYIDGLWSVLTREPDEPP